MTDTKSKADPTITSNKTGPAYPEGTHPVRAPSGPERVYKDNADKPDPSTVAQVEVTE
jgi:hypothetical protein